MEHDMTDRNRMLLGQLIVASFVAAFYSMDAALRPDQVKSLHGSDATALAAAVAQRDSDANGSVQSGR